MTTDCEGLSPRKGGRHTERLWLYYAKPVHAEPGDVRRRVQYVCLSVEPPTRLEFFLGFSVRTGLSPRTKDGPYRPAVFLFSRGHSGRRLPVTQHRDATHTKHATQLELTNADAPAPSLTPPTQQARTHRYQRNTTRLRQTPLLRTRQLQTPPGHETLPTNSRRDATEDADHATNATDATH